jgi:hypothetical protein
MVEDLELEQLLSSFVDEIQTFQYTISSLDHIWNVLFFSQDNKWHHLRIIKYYEKYFFIDISGKEEGLEKPNNINFIHHSSWHLVTLWKELISSASDWLKLVRKDWIKTNKRVQLEFPVELRQGIVPHSLIRASFPSSYRLDNDLGQHKSQKMISLIEEGYFWKRENTEQDSLTANIYFDYCKIAYIAARCEDEIVDEHLSGREMYCLFADGRDDGLLNIDADSSEQFAAWIDHTHPLHHTGGHPWEIKRGGNTTHINLAVYRPSYSSKEGYIIELSGESLGRMAETLKMFIAIHEAKLPISIIHPENIRKRLLAQDNIGIIPEHTSLHRANQSFRKDQDVFDVIYYKDIGRYKRRVTPFITWEPLAILKPNES